MRQVKVQARVLKKAGKDGMRFKSIKGCVFLSGLSVFAQLYLFQPMLSLLCKEFLITPSESSWAVSASTIGMAVGLFILAFNADALSRKKLMTFSLISSSIITILSAFVMNFPLLVAMSFIKGIVISGVSAVALAYLSEEVDVSILGLAISLYLSGNTIGGMFGRVIAALLSGWEWIGWRGASIFVGILSLFLGLLFAKFFPNSKFFTPQKTNFKRKIVQMKNFIKDFSLLRLYFVAALMMGTFVSMYNYLGFRLEAEPFSLPHYVIAFIFLMYITGVVGSMAAGKYSDVYKSSELIKGSTIVTIMGLIMLLVNNLIVTIIGLGLFTFGFFAVHTLASRMVSQKVQIGKSTATSLYWLFYYIGSSFVGSGTGVIYYHYDWHAFIIFLLILVFLSLIFAWTSSKGLAK